MDQMIMLVIWLCNSTWGRLFGFPATIVAAPKEGY